MVPTPSPVLASAAWVEARTYELPAITERQRQVVELIAGGLLERGGRRAARISPPDCEGATGDVLRQKLGVSRRRQIPVAYRRLTGDDPLSPSLGSLAATAGLTSRRRLTRSSFEPRLIRTAVRIRRRGRQGARLGGADPEAVWLCQCGRSKADSARRP